MVNMASLGSQGIRRVLQKLATTLRSGNYYEAHQMYRTLYFRYLGQKNYPKLKELLFQGAADFLQRHQHASGVDLAILFIDVLNKSNTRPEEPFFEQISTLFGLMSASTPEKETFLHDALKWSNTGTSYKWGHPELHRQIAVIFWNENNYVNARQHFVYSKDGLGCALMLIELHQKRGYSNEVDLFIAQTVLQYLCLQNKVTAQEAFDTYTSSHPKIKSGPPYLLPLLNFLFYLLKTIETGKLAVFTVLCEQYQLTLSRDPTYRTYLDKIGQLFFNVPPPRPRNQGLFDTLLQSFFNGLDEDFDEEPRRYAASTSQATPDLD